eukprot:4531869-Ditylum_brightwellii.AAC.1
MGPGAEQKHTDRDSVDSEEQSRASNHLQTDDSTTPGPMDSKEQREFNTDNLEHNTVKTSVEHVADINDELLNNIFVQYITPLMVAITGYRWKDGSLHLMCLMSTEEDQW